MDDGLLQLKRVVGHEVHRIQRDFVRIPLLPVLPAPVHKHSHTAFIALEGEQRFGQIVIEQLTVEVVEGIFNVAVHGAGGSIVHGYLNFVSHGTTDRP